MSVSILHGNTFVVSDDRGDIEASPTEPDGLFAWDTRFLSRWTLTVAGSLLRDAGAGPVFPFALAVATPRGE